MTPIAPEIEGNKRQVALLMGSFNPVHGGHLAVSQYVLSKGLADEVWLVVSPQNPFKSPANLAPFDSRLEMVRLALAEIGDDRLNACDVEASLPQPSYTINTVRFLKKQYPDIQFTILAGSDIADQLSGWHEAEALQSMVRFLFYPRNGGVSSPDMAQAPMYGVDSTSLRAKIANGDFNNNGILSPSVVEYIRNNNLYSPPTEQPITTHPKEAEIYFEQGQEHYRNGNLGMAINDFNHALGLDPNHMAAQQMRDITSNILNFRNTDMYNP